MRFFASIVMAAVAAAPPPTPILEKLRSAGDPRAFELRSPLTGDRGVPASCPLSDGTTVTLVGGQDATLEVERQGAKKTVVVPDVRGLSRPTIACGEGDRFYYVNPRHGRVYGYSAGKLFRGEEPTLWTRDLGPFTSLPDAGHVMTDASVATVAQARHGLLLVEWFYRKDGETGFWHEVLDGASGAELGKIGPSDFLVKTNESDAWWILFQGGGNETANYVPKAIYRLKFASRANNELDARDTLQELRAAPKFPPKALASISSDPAVDHMIALLTPTRTTPNATIEFCPSVPAQRARYWLGSAYNEQAGTLARDVLLFSWIERKTTDPNSNPIDAWFQREIAPREPMRSLLARFNPEDDAWIVAYQKALLELAGPELEAMLSHYLKTGRAVSRPPVTDSP
jgi:hypothetical protein